MMKCLVTGVNGQLGHDLVLELVKRKHSVIGSDIAETYTSVSSDSVGREKYVRMDITDKDSVFHTFSQVNPEVVFHCAAWTAVDSAEEGCNYDNVFNINSKGTSNIVEACKKVGCKLIYISTDYVFNGQGDVPWKPDCNTFEPLNVYGKSKLEGELVVANNLRKFFIVRIAWVFGINGSNFVKAMLRAAQTHSSVAVVNDQIGTPTYTVDLSRLLVDMSETDKYGYYHATNEGGYISWYDFCVEIYKQCKITVNVIPVSTEEYGLNKARRPFNSRLDKSKLVTEGFVPLPSWKDALARYLQEMCNELVVVE